MKVQITVDVPIERIKREWELDEENLSELYDTMEQVVQDSLDETRYGMSIQEIEIF